MKHIILKKGRERSLLRHHPWIFSGAVDSVDSGVRSGETVEVMAADGRFLGRGAWSPSSQIRVRIWTRDREEQVDADFFGRRLEAALRLRTDLGIPELTNAFRLVSAESDGLPGLIVDRYDTILVCQFLSAGSEYWKDEIIDRLAGLTGVGTVYERSDADVRNKEGLKPVQGVLRGDEPPSLVAIEEHGLRFLVDVVSGHKTGFYLDQRENRELVRTCSDGAEVLNCFAYTGGFGLAALKGGAARVTNVEDRAEYLGLMEQNAELNGISKEAFVTVQGDVFRILRQYHQEGRRFDLIVLDPPKFAGSRKQLDGAARGYKDINLSAFRLLNPGGRLFTFSCSGLMTRELFRKIVADAAIDAGRDVQVLHELGQSGDHPVALHIPESLYLKGLSLRISA
ncbi:class I SAM-dependent methyltransferase [bacterium]|nr:class I SAM-dependent methyltransferase [bacterium]